MATLTAQILVGRAHPNSGGINPTHYLFFSENDRPAWVLVPENIFTREPTAEEKIVWIPTVDHVLEDALLMIAIHILKDKEILKLAEGRFLNKSDERAELPHDILDSHLHELREKSRAVQGDHKIVITTLRGSMLEEQLTAIERYKMDVEICVPVFSRLYSRWDNRTNTEGSLS